MNQQGWIAAIIALIIGILLGMFVLSGQSVEPPKDRGEGEEAVPPSVLAAGIPMGTWPQVDCNGEIAVLKLDQIQMLAIDALNTGQLLPPDFARLNNLLYQAALGQAHWAPPTQTPQQSCDKVQASLTHAQGGDWQMSMDDLEHDD